MCNYIQTCSLVSRREWLPPLAEEFLELKRGDWPICVLMSERGWIGYIGAIVTNNGDLAVQGHRRGSCLHDAASMGSHGRRTIPKRELGGTP